VPQVIRYSLGVLLLLQVLLLLLLLGEHRFSAGRLYGLRAPQPVNHIWALLLSSVL